MQPISATIRNTWILPNEEPTLEIVLDDIPVGAPIISNTVIAHVLGIGDVKDVTELNELVKKLPQRIEGMYLFPKGHNTISIHITTPV
jgi:hypothetical protein